jgi:N-acetylglucosamine kinase-like BadF-type ATPase
LDTIFRAAYLGLSGDAGSERVELLQEIVRATDAVYLGDDWNALAGATGGAPGIVTIAGTGSICRGVNAGGKTARAGGWGYIFGDEGSAFDIVRKALRAVLRHEEGWGPATQLRSLLLDGGQLTANELLHRFYSDEYPRARIAALAPLVDEAARAGDPIAQEILATSAQELATIAAAVRRQLFPEGPANVYYVGGVFRSDIVRERFRLLVEMTDGCRVLAPIHGPAAGALLLAYKQAGLPCTLKNVPEEK